MLQEHDQPMPQAPTAPAEAAEAAAAGGKSAAPIKRSFEDIAQQAASQDHAGASGVTNVNDSISISSAAQKLDEDDADCAARRRVRPRTNAAAGVTSCNASRELRPVGAGNDNGVAADRRLAATMAAIAGSITATVQGSHQRDGDAGAVNTRSEIEGTVGKTSEARREAGSGGVADVVEDARRLARNLEVARKCMSPRQLEEVDSLLRQTLRDVRSTKCEGGVGPASLS